jgi:putative ABC transport system permease protein
MIKHSLLLLFRNFLRFKTTFFINLAGLSAGLACSLLIFFWVNDELQFDQFHEKKDRLYQVLENRVRSGGIRTSNTTSGLLGETLQGEMPEVEYAMNVSSDETATLTIGDNNMKAEGRFVGKDFFKMFSFSLLQGDVNQVLLDKSSLAISDELALKLFHTTDNVVGRTVEYDHHDSYIISGVFKKAPQQSSLQPDFLGTFEKYKDGKEWLPDWGNTGTFAFVLLKPGADVTAFNTKFANYIKVKTKNADSYRTPFLKRFARDYLHGNYENGVEAGGRITYVKLFSIIAAFILVLAAINFMNLSTAKASRRMKEVGIKKAVGAGRRTLMLQYLGESLLMSFLSLLLAVLIADLLLPKFNEITNKHIVLHLDIISGLQLIGITLVTGLLAGSYPAIYLSGFSPATVLKGQFSASWGEQWARKGLVIFQFVISIVFIVSVVVIYKQIEFVQSRDLGYQKENVIFVAREGNILTDASLETFLNEIKAIPGVVNASSLGHNLTGHNSGTWGVQWPGKDMNDKTEFENMTVNYDLMETMGIEMKEGRSFSRDFTDTARIIFNEAAIRFMGMEDPIGKVVKLWGSDMEVIGVAKDFNFESLHQKVKPLFLRIYPNDTWQIVIKLAQGPQHETIKRLESTFQKVNPGFIFQYSFLDQNQQALYAAEQRVAVLSRYFAGLAVLISCLGLFGLVSFTAERRLKEIGIRKVLGSSVFRIVFLLSGDFTKTVIIAILLALPLSYFLSHYWLEAFAYRTPLEWWYFVTAGLIALCIAWLTVSVQAFKAARVNPVKCLKEQ